MKRFETVLTTLAIGLCLGFGAALTIGEMPAPSPSKATLPQAATGTVPTSIAPNSTNRQTRVTRAVAQVAPSVVSITTEQPRARLFGRPYRESSASSQGSGVVIDANGVVLTNAHVVSTAARITVTFADGLQADARVLGLSDGLDLAVLRIDPPATLKAVALGSSGALILGEPVIAIGNPFGLGHTVTTGVISATSRALETDERVFQDFIQTDASINPGNSGGPLLNADGELIGINTAIRPDAQGIGFAIPIDRAIKVARDLVEDGVVQLPWLGILVVDVAFSFEGVQRTGPKVVTVLHHATKPATIASNGHLQAGDIILAIQSRPIQGRADMNAYLSSLTAGEPLRITALRQGKTVELEMNTDIPGDKDGLKDAAQRIGWTLEPYADQHRQIVVVTKVRPSGTAAKLGLRPGDIILGIDGRHVTLPADAQSAIQQALAKHRSTALITVQRGHAHGRVALAL